MSHQLISFLTKSLLLFCLSFSAFEACAQINLDKKDSVTKQGKRRNLFVFPVVSYSPETTLAFGAAATLYFKIGHDTTVRTSYVQGIGGYTLRNQTVFGMESAIFFHNERFILKTKGSASYFPDRFWGLGNDSKDGDMEHYTIGQFYFFPQLLRKTYKSLFLGLGYEIQNVFTFDYGQGKPPGTSIFDTQNVNGRYGSFVSGIGLVALWDGRDNTFSPSRGLYFQYYINDYTEAFGSEYNFTYHSVDIRKYYSLPRNHVLAFQFVLNANVGTVPVRSMSNIGSGTIMRGYYEGRYTDNNLIAAQVEDRFHLKGRFGAVVFAATGRVGANSSDLFNLYGLKPAIGAGLRYALDKKEKLNLRFDVGIGDHASGVYFNITEAF
ncbi:MAG TPA: BamA/TamA family outer membrane protein [Cyclobacteriaceae bacterium]|nr:BamA/TamA family outer membrane protein [Cyclobacteriaceae bacterium]